MEPMYIRYNTFTLPDRIRHLDRIGLQSETNDEFYIYELDKNKKKHIKILIKKEDLKR